MPRKNVRTAQMTMERKRLSDMNAAKYNPRTMSEEAYFGLKSSIEVFGYVDPIVWNQRTGNVVGGHQRMRALAEKGFQEADVVVVDVDEATEKAMNVALNNDRISGSFTSDLHKLLGDIMEHVGDMNFSSLKYDELSMSVGLPPESIEIPYYDESNVLPKQDEKHREVTCPKCGHAFQP